MDLTQLKLHFSKEIEVSNILDGINKPNLNDAFFLAMDMLNHEPEDWELKLHVIDAIMEAHGVEKLVEDGKAIASYVNTGETYSATVLYDHEEQEFLITSWGDFYEEWQSENLIEIDCQQVANQIYNISHSPYIEWEEWIEYDREEYDSDEDYFADAAIDIRLQIMEGGSWSLPYGVSDFDQDHRGAWGSSSVGKCVSMEKAMEIAKDLIEQAAESADCNLTKTVRAYNDD